MNTPEIEELKRLVEEHYGKHLTTTTDFEEFSVILRLRHEIFVSPSTLSDCTAMSATAISRACRPSTLYRHI